ncbi:MAG: HAD-IC family P-type ATPase, partial [Myxococcota bacterium]
CALSMATPLALAIFVARAARRGIFVKHDDVIESIARAHTMVLDKTGTLTEGRMAVLGWHGATSAVHLAAALERHSAHPIAEALVRLGDERGWSPLGLDTDVTDVPGKGLTGVLEEQEVCVGRIDWLLSKDDTPKEVLAFVDEHVQRGHTPIAITVDGSFGAVVALGDPVRPEAPALLETLRARGITPIIASGDHEGVVRHVGASLGLPEANIHGAMSPEDKLALIESLKRPGEPVVMVGDGVNDAAAMQAADIGVAVPGGAQASFVAADVFLTRGGLAGVVSLIVGSERTLTTIRRNLTGSALYNAFGITLAALGFVTPLLAAILMPISSVSVVASSLLHRSLPRSAAEVDAKHSDVTGLMPEEVTP